VQVGCVAHYSINLFSVFKKGIKSDIISGNNKSTTQLPPALGPKQGNENNNSVIQQARTGVQARFEYAYGNY